MGVEAAIYTQLSGYAGLTALVGTRIYPRLLPQSSSKPAVVYSRVSSERFSAFSTDSGVVKARMQCDVYAATYDAALAVREQVRGALQRYSVDSPLKVFDTYILNEIDLYDSETELHHLVLDFEINYQET